MKKYAIQISRITFVAITLLICSGKLHALIILDEDFEGYDPNTPLSTIEGWRSTGSPAVADTRNAPSPYDVGFGQSLYLHPGGETGTYSIATYDFNEVSGHLSFSTDVYLAANAYAAVVNLRSGNSNLAQVLFRGASQDFRIYHQDAVSDGYTSILNPTSPMRGWYRIELELYLDETTPSNGRYDVTIYSLTQDEVIVELKGLKLNIDGGSIDNFQLSTTFGAAASHYWDNVYLESIPEPGVYGGLVGGSLLLFFIWRRKHPKN